MSKNKELSPDEEYFLGGCIVVFLSGFLASVTGLGIGLLCMTFMKAVGLSILCGMGGFGLALLFACAKEGRRQRAANACANSRPE